MGRVLGKKIKGWKSRHSDGQAFPIIKKGSKDDLPKGMKQVTKSKRKVAGKEKQCVEEEVLTEPNRPARKPKKKWKGKGMKPSKRGSALHPKYR